MHYCKNQFLSKINIKLLVPVCPYREHLVHPSEQDLEFATSPDEKQIFIIIEIVSGNKHVAVMHASD